MFNQSFSTRKKSIKKKKKMNQKKNNKRKNERLLYIGLCFHWKCWWICWCNRGWVGRNDRRQLSDATNATLGGASPLTGGDLTGARWYRCRPHWIFLAGMERFITTPPPSPSPTRQITCDLFAFQPTQTTKEHRSENCRSRGYLFYFLLQ